MTLQTARDFLADNNLAIRGARGKLSNDAKAFLAKAIAAGTKFSDWDENGKIKLEPVRVRKAAVGGSRSIGSVKADCLGLTKEQLAESAQMEHNADVAWVKPERKPHTVVPPLRKENAISVIDNRGTNIVVSSCKYGHNIARCICKVIEPAPYLNAQSFELIVSDHA